MTNTEEIKRLAEITNNFCSVHSNPELRSEDLAKKILEHYLPSSSVVSPLVWEEPNKPNDYYDFYAETPLGKVYIQNRNEEWGVWLSKHFILSGGKTLQEAKAEAYKTYSTLIGSCLVGGGWRKVDENTPDLTLILVHYPDRKEKTIIAEREHGIWFDSRGDDLEEAPTHWMPLPEAPLSSLKQQ